jgi:hypothetical protein
LIWLKEIVTALLEWLEKMARRDTPAVDAKTDETTRKRFRDTMSDRLR